MACINSMGDNFSDMETKSCCFHFSQAIYRQILGFVFAVQYREEKDFSFSENLVVSHAFAPFLLLGAC